MFIQEELQGLKKIKGAGIIKSLIIPAKLDTLKSKHNLSISVPKKEITFIKGKSVFILADNYAIKDKVNFSVFFIGNYLVIELNKGTIYVKSSDKYYAIDSKNTVKEYKDDLKLLCFREFSNLYADCFELVTRKYNLSDLKEKEKYVNNLGYSVLSSYDYEAGKLYEFKIYEYFDDLALGKVVFEEKPLKTEEKILVLPEPVLSSYDANCDYVIPKKKNHKSLLSDMTLSLDEDYEEADELPENMHEVDLLKESELELEEE